MKYMGSLRGSWFAAILACTLSAQVLEFDSNGLHYRALTKGGVTVMYAPIATRVLGYSILQVSISNGSPVTWSFQPEDFRFDRESGSVRALSANVVVGNVLDKAGHGDVDKLITAYESALYSNIKMHSTNGYEARKL